MIELENIHRDFQVGDQWVHALDGITLAIDDGDYVSVMGPSGSGKSTLLNILGLLDRPSGGRYRLDGEEVSAMSEVQQAEVRNRRIGFVFQSFHLVPRLTAYENVELPLMLAGIPPQQRRPRIDEVLQALGLSERAGHKPDQLSGGQRQRVAIARAIINRPSVLLADEPTGNLDRKSGLDVIETLEALNRDGITLIVVTHDPSLGERAARALRLVDGHIVEDRRRRPVGAASEA